VAHLPHIVHESRVRDYSADMLASKKRRVDGAIGAGQFRAANRTADVMEEQTSGLHEIRGRDLPGPTDASAAGGDSPVVPAATTSTASIRGLGVEPGPLRDDRGRRAQEKLDARNSHLRRSLDDHAERVSKRLSQHPQEDARGSAAERMAALRRRVAERSARTRGGPQVGGEHDRAVDPLGGGADSARGPGDVQCAAGGARGHISHEGGGVRQKKSQKPTLLMPVTPEERRHLWTPSLLARPRPARRRGTPSTPLLGRLLSLG
jgi:hypothetical protein